MKYITLIIIVFCCTTSLYSQEKDTEYLYKKVVEYQIDFERKDNKFSSMNLYFIDMRFSNIELSYEGVFLKNFNKIELNNESKKGVDIIEVYPIKVFGDKIEIETLSIFKKRKKITVYGKSTYSFKYDFEKQKYILIDKNQKML